MDKKITAIIFLLIVFVSITFAYVYIDDPEPEEKQVYSSSEPTDDEINKEIDDLFIDEDDQIDIGEII